jgi:hypothetical protein
MSGLGSPAPLPRPTSFDQRWASALVEALQRWFDGLRGDIEIHGKLINRSGRRRHISDVTDATYTAKLTDDIIAVTRAGTVTITLPEAPPNGTALSIVEAGGNPDVITILRAGGDTITGLASIDNSGSPYRWLELCYDAANAEWLVR